MFPLHDSVARRYPPLMVWTLIALNAVVFLFEASLPKEALEALINYYGFVPARYTDPAWALQHGLSPNNYLPFLTMMFLHGGWSHLIGNMWTLWLFGAAVEDRMGSGRFLVFYLLCGFAAGLTQLMFNAYSTVPAIGASGAIAGVMGAYTLLFPTARILFFIPVLFFPFFFEWPALLFTGVWFLIQFLQGVMELFSPAVGGGIAWWAHVGGFVFGLALVRLFVRPERMRYFPDQVVLSYGPRDPTR